MRRLDEQAAKEPGVWLRVAAERLSLLRYVYLVQIEDGIPSASQRSALEYADAVLMGWPDPSADGGAGAARETAVADHNGESPEVTVPRGVGLEAARSCIASVERSIPRFRELERQGDIDSLSDVLVHVTEEVAQVRHRYQPGFPLPTFAEIRRVVEEEWNEDMRDIAPEQANPTADQFEKLTRDTDRRHRQERP